MKKPKILVLEDRIYYRGLIEFDEKLYNVEYNGLKYYKSNLNQFDLIVSFDFIGDLGNFIITKAKIQGVKTLLIADGILEWSNMFNNKKVLSKNLKLFHPILHDYFFCVGEIEASYFRSLGQKTKNYIPIRMNSTKNKMNSTKSMANSKHDFLITTANTAYHNQKEKTLLITILKKIKKDLEKSNLTYGFRLFDKSLLKELGLSDNYISDNFSDTLKNFKCLISTPSSIIITAMELNIPVAQIIYRDSPIFVQSGWLISNLNFDSTFDSMLKFEKERMDFQRFQIQNYLNCQSDISEIVKSPLNENKKKIEFDIRLYNMINSRYNFNIEYIFRKMYLFLKKI